MSSTHVPLWAEWNYDQDQWKQFLECEWIRQQRAMKEGIGISLLLTPVAIGMFCGLINIGSHKSVQWEETISLFLLGFTSMLILVVGSYYLTYKRARDRKHRWLAGPPRVCITPVGIYIATDYVPLVRVDWFSIQSVLYLDDVRVLPQDPTVLQFRGHVLVPTMHPYEIRLPIPTSREAEISQLIARFRKEVINARVWVSAPSRYPASVETGSNPATHLLPSRWVGGTSESARYGKTAQALTSKQQVEPDHPTQPLAPDTDK